MGLNVFASFSLVAWSETETIGYAFCKEESKCNQQKLPVIVNLLFCTLYILFIIITSNIYTYNIILFARDLPHCAHHLVADSLLPARNPLHEPTPLLGDRVALGHPNPLIAHLNF